MSNDHITLCIIDLHAILHLVKHSAVSKGIHKDEENTFLIHGFLYKLRYLCSKIEPPHVVFACDSLTNHRKQVYKDYKYKRSDKTEEQIRLDGIAYPQFSAIKEYILPTIGYRNIIELDGFEADDVMASICKCYPRNNKIVITEDRDLYQVLRDNTIILSPRTHRFFTVDDFKEAYGITPDKWALVKTYGGCVSDSVPGINFITASGQVSSKRFGEKTALQYIRGEFSPVKSQYLSVQDERNKEIIERNKKLVTLPYEGTPRIKIKTNRLSFEGFLSIVEKYGFRQMDNDAPEFKRVLRLA